MNKFILKKEDISYIFWMSNIRNQLLINNNIL